MGLGTSVARHTASVPTPSSRVPAKSARKPDARRTTRRWQGKRNRDEPRHTKDPHGFGARLAGARSASRVRLLVVNPANASPCRKRRR